LAPHLACLKQRRSAHLTPATTPPRPTPLAARASLWGAPMEDCLRDDVTHCDHFSIAYITVQFNAIAYSPPLAL